MAVKGHWCHMRGVLSGSSHMSWSSILTGLRTATEELWDVRTYLNRTSRNLDRYRVDVETKESPREKRKLRFEWRAAYFKKLRHIARYNVICIQSFLYC